VTPDHSVQLRRLFRGRATLAAAILWLMGLCGATSAADGLFGHGPYACPSGFSERKGELEARAGYLWGTNQIRFRDGDNSNLPAGQKEVSLESPIFGIVGETFRSRDFALRAQGWINLPQSRRSDWLLEPTARLWETEARYLAADVSLIYHLGLGGMPYSAGLAAGYRYNDFDYESLPGRAPAGNYEDHIHVHIPYVGVFYGNGNFAGTVVRLDVLISPLTMSRIDSEQHLQGVTTQVTGQSLTGLWFESFFAWYWPMSQNARFGAFVNYNFLELSGGATVRRTGASTRFSMDSTTHLVTAGLTAAYSF